MSKKIKLETIEQSQSETIETAAELVLVTFSSEEALSRFEVAEHQAKVDISDLKEGEKFVVINGKTFIEYSINGATYLL